MTLVSTLTLGVAIGGYYWFEVRNVHTSVEANAGKAATLAARAITEMIERGDRRSPSVPTLRAIGRDDAQFFFHML